MRDGPSEVLIEEASPTGTLRAVVEADDRTVYLYLLGPEASDFEWVACWVRNLLPAPVDYDTEAMGRGEAPLLPARACRFPTGKPAPSPDDLSLLWFSEGDALALLEGDQVLAVIPPWSGLEGCAGYARDCVSKTPLAWPLGPPEHNEILEMVREAAAFAEVWANGDPWKTLQAGYLQAIEAGLSTPHTAYYAIDGGRWPPRLLAEVHAETFVAWVTGGVSIRRQPKVAKHVADPRAARRIELGLALDSALAEAMTRPLLGTLSRLAATPWQHQSWLGAGHTVPARGVPVGADEAFTAFLIRSAPPGAPPVAFADYEGDPVNLLWLTPITDAERALVMAEGSDALSARLDAAGVTWIHRDRAAVA